MCIIIIIIVIISILSVLPYMSRSVIHYSKMSICFGEMAATSMGAQPWDPSFSRSKKKIIIIIIIKWRRSSALSFTLQFVCTKRKLVCCVHSLAATLCRINSYSVSDGCYWCLIFLYMLLLAYAI